jgi:2-polyprenyl-3-methyl-5-hydroxy-6-metoxy-1,4-benzoquinol methylase
MSERLRHCPLCEGADLPPLFTRDGYDLVRCGACELVFVVNPPSEEQLAELYSFASGYHTEFRDDPAVVAERFGLAAHRFEALERHHPRPGRLLDIGAAAGFFVKTAQDAGWTAQGVELSPDTAALGRERYGVDVQAARLEEVELPPESFDAVTLWDVIEHVSDPLDTMRRVAGLLKPGGTVGLLTPNIDGLYPRLSYKVAKLVKGWPSVEPPGHLFQFSTRTLTELLRRCGIEVLEVVHETQPISYSFGSVRRDPSPQRAAYKSVFAPLALLGPKVGAGDEILVIARKAA